MYNRKDKFQVCATCLSFRDRYELNSDLPLTEDIRKMLRSLLYDFDIEGFFRSKPPDKHLRLCRKCNNTLQEMIAFKERVQKSFSEFMKYWCVDGQPYTGSAVTGLSSAQSGTVTVLRVNEIDHTDLKYDEPDPLEINEPDTKDIENIIDIKEETDIFNVNEDTNIININEFNEPEPVATIKQEQEEPKANNNAGTPQDESHTNNKKEKLINEVFNGSVAQTSDSAVKPRNNFVINKVTATNTSQNSSNNKFVKRVIVVPSSNKFVINKFTATTAKSHINSNFLNSSVTVPRNDNLNQNTAARVSISATVNKNFISIVGSDIFNTNKAATEINDLEDVIRSNLLCKKNDGIMLKNILMMPNNTNFNIRTSDITHMNNTSVTTNRNILNDFSSENNKIIFERVSVDDGEVVAKNKQRNPQVVKIVKIDSKGNIQNIGKGVIKPITESKEVQQPSAIISRESLANSEPTLNADITRIEGEVCRIPASDDTSATESEEEFGYNKRPNMSTSDYRSRKWYIKIVTREDILKKMEERRNKPEFLKAPYKCVSCALVLDNEQLLEKHKKACHKDSEFICFACRATFENFHKLNAHFYVHTMDSCIYYCTTCEFETKHVEFMRDHLCINAGSEALPPKDPNTMKLSSSKSLYYCPKCEFISPRACTLILHYTNFHKNSPKLPCGECGKLYKNKYGLRYHVDTAHRGKKKVGAPVPMYCTLCAKWFASKPAHYIHMKRKHAPGDSKFECNECGKKLLTAEGQKNHKEYHELMKTGVKNHKCSICGNAYYTQKVLRTHIQNKHEKKRTSRDHVCEFCGMAFFTNMMLKGHSAKHSDARPYKCSLCGDTFKYTAALHTHTKLKHKKNRNAEGIMNKKKTRETPKKDKGQEKRRKEKRKKIVKRKRVESSSTEEELTGFAEES